jgi:hypothetical protein
MHDEFHFLFRRTPCLIGGCIGQLMPQANVRMSVQNFMIIAQICRNNLKRETLFHGYIIGLLGYRISTTSLIRAIFPLAVCL